MSCKVQDGTIKSVNPDGYWYRITSSPWNDRYYAPANTFLNGDPPTGPYSHNTDFAVPDCDSSASIPVAPTVTLAKGHTAPFGFRYAVTLTGFGGLASVSVTCYDSVDPRGFFTFWITTNRAGSASVANQCYSGDGPDHWVIADGVESNHVTWGAGTSAAEPPPRLVPTSPSPAPKPPHHRWIVSLGDSYTAGNGAGANYDSCERSYNSYPWLYMNRLRGAGLSADIWQAACSGNVIGDVAHQVSETLKSPAKNQASIVFLTIGGNDLDFSLIVKTCLLPYASYHPISFATCAWKINSALNNLSTVVDHTRAVLQNIANEMPHAQIILLGYPLLTSPACPETPWNGTITRAQNAFDESQNTMIMGLNRDHSGTRFHFISVANLFLNHGPCASQSAQYVRGADYPTWKAYHPNLTGDEAIANLLYSRFRSG